MLLFVFIFVTVLTPFLFFLVFSFFFSFFNKTVQIFMTARVISGKYGFSYMLKYNPERLALNPILPSAKGQMTWQWLVYIWL